VNLPGTIDAGSAGASPDGRMPPARRPIWPRLAWLLAAALAFLLPAVFLPATPSSAQQPVPTPNPALRLATPVMPENPTQVDIGRELYWYHCMPCHGDRGQGLTDEWREVWVDDHQDCWARGCHTGRPGDEGFPIPHSVPAVIGPSTALALFANADALAAYLHVAHPPQRPGALGLEDCQAITAFLFEANRNTEPQATPFALVTISVCALVFAGLWLFARRGP